LGPKSRILKISNLDDDGLGVSDDVLVSPASKVASRQRLQAQHDRLDSSELKKAIQRSAAILNFQSLEAALVSFKGRRKSAAF
jgi:hypothetical protein